MSEIIKYDLFDGEQNMVKIAIERLRMFEPPEGYYLAFSGGKDSQTIYHLAEMAGVKFDAHFHLTTVDPPELVYFVRNHYPKVEVSKPEKSMWKLCVDILSLPFRTRRFCCKKLKEHGGHGRIVVTGIRAQESARRAKRKMVEVCYNDPSKSFLHPIFDWTEKDVWSFLGNRPHCSLYDEGYKRIGCIMCPMSGKTGMERDAKRWPKYYQAYLRTIGKIIEERKRRGLVVSFETPEEMMEFWINGKGIEKPDENQTVLFFD